MDSKLLFNLVFKKYNILQLNLLFTVYYPVTATKRFMNDPDINESLKRSIAFFDFDGTVTTKDTLIEFIRHSKGTAALASGFLVNLPSLIAFKLGLISNQRAKEKILRYFYEGMLLSDFENICRSFATEVIPYLLRPEAKNEFEKLQKRNFEIVIVSASPETWIKPWADKLHFGLIASKLEIVDGKITGRMAGTNCHGEEKVIRIRERFLLEEFQDIYTYGDSRADRPMLALGSKSFMKPFH
jgi:phosphatidylglycerophosphatase C